MLAISEEFPLALPPSQIFQSQTLKDE
ncbi:hypothetical protein NITHO_2730004 [Nitrolancea hollandica Lb]|uniref:Uncharacterized protein n=1 Tax=Nitrolancea hollandica Lb TaxID=1129897 RepID=I4EGJ1_9BACT|nr:hypothetical protein NITHO_2730004 [Nitrolancea hollandica Lb]